MFEAERHTTGSNYQLTPAGFPLGRQQLRTGAMTAAAPDQDRARVGAAGYERLRSPRSIHERLRRQRGEMRAMVWPDANRLKIARL